jgi:hypothetical protein
MIDSYPDRGYFKYLRLDTMDWESIARTGLYPMITDETLALVLTFNIYNPSMNQMQAFKLIFNFQAGGLILLEFDRVMVKLSIFGGTKERTYAILCYVIGGILLAISIVDIRRQKALLPKVDKDANHKGPIKRIITCATCREWLSGAHNLDIVNIVMILLSFISLSIKYGYDQFVEAKFSAAKQSLDHKIQNTSYVDFSSSYIYYETLAVLDSLLIFLMSASILKYTFFWIPSLATLTTALRAYVDSTLKHMIWFLLLLSLALSLYFHYFYAYVCFGFFDLGFSMIRTSMLFV